MTRDQFRVRARTLIPAQQITSNGLKRSTNCYERYMLKFSGQLAIFHSLAELYHAVHLESEPSVTSYVPQPFVLWIGKFQYCPDCYVVRDGKRYVVELKPCAEFDEKKRRSLERYFHQNGMTFQVLANESYLEQSVLMQNWLTIISKLHTCGHIPTDRQEIALIDQLSLYESLPLGELIDPGDRLATMATEIALFKLLHRGIVRADLANAPLDYSTEFSL